MVFSAFDSHCGAEFSLLVGRSLDWIVNLVFASNGSRLLEADVAVKIFDFRKAAVYAPNIATLFAPFTTCQPQLF